MSAWESRGDTRSGEVVLVGVEAVFPPDLMEIGGPEAPQPATRHISADLKSVFAPRFDMRGTFHKSESVSSRPESRQGCRYCRWSLIYRFGGVVLSSKYRLLEGVRLFKPSKG
jgi:hypothetical protein